MENIKVGDFVDFSGECVSGYRLKVVKLVDDVRAQVGMPADEEWPGSDNFIGAGVVAEPAADPDEEWRGDYFEGDSEVVICLKQIYNVYR